MTDLLEMLRYRRPDLSVTEEAFIDRFLRPLGATEDGYGNLFLDVGNSPTVLWSSHTDTVHHAEGMQKIHVHDDFVSVVQSNCLGADCTAGVWLMAELAKAKKPGRYIWHRAEEVGGRGSSWIAEENPQLLDGIQFAIALDRRGTTSVITHQCGSRCCSDAFAASLAEQLGKNWKLDDWGIFTDTANYTDIVPECTNVSVGYRDEHTRKEILDLRHVKQLRDSLIALDYDLLIAEREPGTDDYTDPNALLPWDIDAYSAAYGSSRDLYWLVKDHPQELADWLEENGMDAATLLSIVKERR